jgi:hypothetical protein
VNVTRPVSMVAALSVFAVTGALGMASANAADPAPAFPTVSVSDTSVDQFQSIEVGGTGFVASDKTVKVRVTQVLPPNPDPDVPQAPAFESTTEVEAVRADGTLPAEAPGSGDKTFVEVNTDASWPEGDYKVTATYTDAAGDAATTPAADVAVSDATRDLGIDSPNYDKNGQIQPGQNFLVKGVGNVASPDELLDVSLHKRGHSKEVLRYDSTPLHLVEGVITGNNTYTLPDALEAGEYVVQLTNDDNGQDVAVARFALSVKTKYIAPPPNPDPVPDPDPKPDPEPTPDPDDDKDNETPPPVVTPPAPEAAPVTPVQPPATKAPVVKSPKTPKAPKTPVAETPKAPEPVQAPAVETAPVKVGEADAPKAKPVKAATNTTDAVDPKPVTDDQAEIEALPGLTFSEKEPDEVTLAGAPTTKGVSAAPLVAVVAAMVALVAGAGVLVRKFTA